MKVVVAGTNLGFGRRLTRGLVGAVVVLVATALGWGSVVALASVPAAGISSAVCTTATPTVGSATELDDAIACYNAQTPAGDHTVTFGQTIIHPTGTPFIASAGTGDLVIDGANHTLTGPLGPDGTGPDIDGLVYLFLVNNPNNETTITDLTINGADSDGIHNFDGTLTVSNLNVHNNGDGGIVNRDNNGGTVTVSSSVVHSNGIVGIANDGGTFAVSSSTIDNNGGHGIANLGGGASIDISSSSIDNNDTYGIRNDGGTVTVSNSTIENNIHGILIDGGTVTVSSSTITGASDAGIFSSGTLAVSNSTVHNNGRHGIYNQGGTVRVANSTVINNTADVVDIAASVSMWSSIVGDCSVPVSDQGNNFGADGSCGAGFTVLSPGSLAVDLADNGCTEPCTQTLALLTGSNASGAGNCSNVPVGHDPFGALVIGDLEFDQRGAGFPRTQASICDAGAFEVDCTNPFSDVPGGQFYTDAVIWAACNGITTGTSAVTFSPSDTVTRAQMATFLWRFAGRPTGSPEHDFVDVPAGQFYTEPVKWLASTGITTGTSAVTFSPNDTVTRAQMATFLWRFSNQPAATPGSDIFTDVPPGAYYDIATGWMSTTNVTTGTSATTYSPNADLTRSQAVTFLLRLAKLPK